MNSDWIKTQFSLILLGILLIFFTVAAFKAYHYRLDPALSIFLSDSAKQVMAALFTLITIRVVGQRKDDQK